MNERESRRLQRLQEEARRKKEEKERSARAAEIYLREKKEEQKGEATEVGGGAVMRPEVAQQQQQQLQQQAPPPPLQAPSPLPGIDPSAAAKQKEGEAKITIFAFGEYAIRLAFRRRPVFCTVHLIHE